MIQDSRISSKIPLFALIGLVLLSLGGTLQAAEIDSGDTAWISASTALVLFMTLPGLALFYGGLVQGRNVLSVLMHCFAIACVMTLVWVVAGYSLAFSGDGKFIGNLDLMFLKGFEWDAANGTIPNILHFMFQMTFFIITPALIIGTFVERIKFSAMMVFITAWSLLVYAPVCHMVWGEGGWLIARETPTIDLAGGVVVHITAGFAALLACIMIGPRQNPRPPHNLVLTVMGTCMLWVGWFGFNGGSGLAANAAAAMSITVTHISAATAACTWAAIEWFGHTKKPSVLGIATGSIAGLAAITPAAGVAGPMGAILIGFLSGAICFWFSVKLKNKLGYDDSLDVFGVHGIGGLVGTLMAAVVGLEALGGIPDGDGNFVNFGPQITTQLIASVFTIVFTLVVTFIILKVVDMTIGLRVDENAETIGLDQASHGETAYND